MSACVIVINRTSYRIGKTEMFISFFLCIVIHLFLQFDPKETQGKVTIVQNTIVFRAYFFSFLINPLQTVRYKKGEEHQKAQSEFSFQKKTSKSNKKRVVFTCSKIHIKLSNVLRTFIATCILQVSNLNLKNFFIIF